MSFGLDIITHDADGNELVVEVVDGHTYNLAPMWRKALPDVLGDGSTSKLDGWNCGNLLSHLRAGVVDAVEHDDEYRALDPENGWGDFNGFVEIFSRFWRLCAKHPSGTVRWNG